MIYLPDTILWIYHLKQPNSLVTRRLLAYPPGQVLQCDIVKAEPIPERSVAENQPTQFFLAIGAQPVRQLVDLKKGEFKPEYAGKMNFYCSVVDDQLRHPQDQPTLGLILCHTKDQIIAEYSLRDIDKPIGVADYELTRALPEKLASSLPSIEAIEAELSLDLDKEANDE